MPHPLGRIIRCSSLFAALSLAALSALHLLGLSIPYYFDDVWVIANNGWLHAGPAPGLWFGTYFADAAELFPAFRPLLMLSYWFDARIWGVTPEGFRLTTILLHTLNALWIYRAGRLLGLRVRWAWIASAVFLIHPVQVLALDMIWKRSSVLEAFGFLALLNLHLSYPGRGVPSPRWATPLMLMIFPFALLTKETALLLPPTLLILDFANRRLHRDKIPRYVGLILEALAFAYVRFVHMPAWLGEHYTFLSDGRELSPGAYAVATLGALPLYLMDLVAPHLSFISDPLPTPSVAGAAMSVILPLAGLLYVRFATSSQSNGLFIWCLGAALFHLCSYALTPLFFFYDPVRLYLPLAFVVLGALGGVQETLRHAPPKVLLAAMGAGALCVVVYAVQTVWLHQRFHDPVATWKDTVLRFPHSDLAWGEYGQALEHRGQNHEAALAYATAFERAPKKSYYLLHALSQSDTSKGSQNAQTLRSLLEALAPESLPLGEVFFAAELARKHGYRSSALRFTTYLLEKKPRYAPAHMLLGLLYLEQPEHAQKASDAFQTAASFDPSLPLEKHQGKWVPTALKDNESVKDMP